MAIVSVPETETTSREVVIIPVDIMVEVEKGVVVVDLDASSMVDEEVVGVDGAVEVAVRITANY